MRQEKSMFNLILGIAKADDRIRAVYMNGSRTNPNIQKDIYQDYDIIFVVTETKSFLTDKKNWIPLFGKLAMVQEPDSTDLGWGLNHDFTASYGWLMLFKDGNRIDLHILTERICLKDYLADNLTVKLLDKDNILPEIPPPNDSSHWIKPPSKQQYDGCCNEFWWCLNNVAKGIARDQLPYLMRMLSCIIHPELEKMIEWYIGMNNDFSVSTGMWGKYFKKYLPSELYEIYTKTYATGNYQNIWHSIFITCDLFRTLAKNVAEYFNFEYNEKDDQNIMAYLEQIKSHTTLLC